MKLTPFNEQKFKDVTKRLHLYETEGIEPEVRQWVEKQQAINEMDNFQRKTKLTDHDIILSLINLLNRIDPARLLERDKSEFNRLKTKFNLP